MFYIFDKDNRKFIAAISFVFLLSYLFNFIYKNIKIINENEKIEISNIENNCFQYNICFKYLESIKSDNKITIYEKNKLFDILKELQKETYEEKK